MKLQDIKGIGTKTLNHLNSANIFTVDELIHTFPKSYLIYEINNEELFSCRNVSVMGTIESSPVFIKYNRNVNTIIFYVNIDSYKVKCVYFSSDYLRYKLFKGIQVILYGKYKLVNKEFVISNIFFDNFDVKVETDYKIKGLPNHLITKAVKNAFELGYSCEDNLPIELLNEYKLLNMKEYLYLSHFPKNKTDYLQIQRRRKYEEFFWYSMSLEILRQNRYTNYKMKRNIDYKMIEIFIKSLPYELTKDQLKAINDIYDDIINEYPMNRLIQGDVGCGKSIVSYISALMLCLAGYQAVIMVPTETLAVQQYNNIIKILKYFNLSIELLTSSIKSKDKADILYRLENNRVNIIVGTHALIEENVKFYKLGIVIIDEQHKFGVNQRAKLISKFKGVDCLYLTATPIPRTLGLTSFGDLDISSILTMPKNRKPIKTVLWDNNKLDKLYQSMRTHLAKKEQAYVVVPLVTENEDIIAMDINTAYEEFSNNLAGYNIAIVHGKMKSIEKNKIMSDFKNGKIDVLISTTVIEVGVDVSNATMMIIMNADRYGLAQIHQLRGRVGRGEKESFCVLVTNDLDNERLNILRNISNGFDIAVEDFKLRGPGNYLGEDQSGFDGLNYVDFQADFNIWSYAKKDGERYAKLFIKNNSQNKKYLELVNINKNQNIKIN